MTSDDRRARGIAMLLTEGDFDRIGRIDNDDVRWLLAELSRADFRADDFEGRYETSHASRMWAEECFRAAEVRASTAEAAIREALSFLTDWAQPHYDEAVRELIRAATPTKPSDPTGGEGDTRTDPYVAAAGVVGDAPRQYDGCACGSPEEHGPHE